MVNLNVYSNKPDGWGGEHPGMRFGPEADRRVLPMVKRVIYHSRRILPGYFAGRPFSLLPPNPEHVAVEAIALKP